MVECGYWPLVQLLHAQCSNIEVKNKSQRTIIFFVVSKRLLELLLEAWTDVNTRDKFDQTILFMAALNADDEIVEMPLDTGIDINAKNVKGCTALLHVVIQQSDAFRTHFTILK